MSHEIFNTETEKQNTHTKRNATDNWQKRNRKTTPQYGRQLPEPKPQPKPKAKPVLKLRTRTAWKNDKTQTAKMAENPMKNV